MPYNNNKCREEKSREGGIIKWEAVSVRPSVCTVPQYNSRTERPRKPRFCRMEANRTSNPRTYLEVKRSPGGLMLTQ